MRISRKKASGSSREQKDKQELKSAILDSTFPGFRTGPASRKTVKESTFGFPAGVVRDP
jgi:hypothetical protein